MFNLYNNLVNYNKKYNIKIKENKKQKLFEEVLIMYNTFLLVKDELVNNTKKL